MFLKTRSKESRQVQRLKGSRASNSKQQASKTYGARRERIIDAASVQLYKRNQQPELGDFNSEDRVRFNSQHYRSKEKTEEAYRHTEQPQTSNSVYYSYKLP